MSILIRGMEMPTSEEQCKLYQPAPFRSPYCVINGVCRGLEACPLVPVPPHGRLGDLDKLVEKIDGIWDCNDMVFKPNDHCCNVPEDCKGCKWAQTKDCIQRMVENAPTIIPAEPFNNLSKPCKDDDDSPICTKASPASLGIYKKAEEGE